MPLRKTSQACYFLLILRKPLTHWNGPFIQKTLLSFGFSPSIIRWFKTFYHKTESCILNNGWASDFLSIHRGVQQGCPLSPYHFILSAEILAKAIQKTHSSKVYLLKKPKSESANTLMIPPSYLTARKDLSPKD